MKKVKALLSITVLAFCLNAGPVATKTQISAFARTPVAVQTSVASYGAVLSEGRSRTTQITIAVTLGVAAAVIGIVTCGAGAIVAGVLGGF